MAIANTWKDVEARNRGIDAGVPKHGAAHLDAKTKLAEQGERNRQARETALRKEKPVQPSTNLPPALASVPKVPPFPAVKKGG
jgi:hypothetical protein